jgi:UDP-glucose 4-epimerase
MTDSDIIITDEVLGGDPRIRGTRVGVYHVMQYVSKEYGVEEIASDEDPSVMQVAEMVRRIASEECGLDVDVSLVENPRSAETLVEEFGVETSVIEDVLGWTPEESAEASIRSLLK